MLVPGGPGVVPRTWSEGSAGVRLAGREFERGGEADIRSRARLDERTSCCGTCGAFAPTGACESNTPLATSQWARCHCKRELTAQLNLMPHCVFSKLVIFLTSANVHGASGVDWA